MPPFWRSRHSPLSSCSPSRPLTRRGPRLFIVASSLAATAPEMSGGSAASRNPRQRAPCRPQGRGPCGPRRLKEACAAASLVPLQPCCHHAHTRCISQQARPRPGGYQRDARLGRRVRRGPTHVPRRVLSERNVQQRILRRDRQGHRGRPAHLYGDITNVETYLKQKYGL
jgi:hypothetical protein